ncbi:MAG: pantoate kinase, partial [Haloarculaceae archaeon]
VPGHVTGIFTTDRDPDPTKAGSRGAGVCLSDGVSVTVEHAEEPAVVLDGDPVGIEAVERVLRTLEAPARVEAETVLPLGSGFGVSAALALGTALAVNEAFDRRLSENELVTIAHGAEVEAGTGLGDVVAQARGGVPIRLEPGGPQVNVMDGIPTRGRVEYLALDELQTEVVIGGDTEALTEAGTRALSEVVSEPTRDRFMRAARTFAREAGLLTEDVKAIVDDVAEAGGSASMAMLGETVFAFGTGLSDAGYEPRITRVNPGGATVRATIE